MAEMEAPQMIRILGFAGSLRRGSDNRALLRAAQELVQGRLLGALAAWATRLRAVPAG